MLSLQQDFVICVNLLGSCYGSTGPGSVDPETGLVYGPDFPLVSIRDNVRAQSSLLDSLGIRRLRLILGGSIGGMQALEWAIHYPERVEKAAIIGVAPLSAMGLALNHLQRHAIQSDPNWDAGYYLPQRPPKQGLSLARQIGMISYKSASLLNERFSRNPNRNGENPWSLDDLGGGLIGGRFDIAVISTTRASGSTTASTPIRIWRLCEPWTPGIPVTGFGSPQEVFGRIRAQLIFLGISSDWLFPPESVRDFARTIASAGVRAEYREMVSSHGHDAFLAEQAELVPSIAGSPAHYPS